MNPNDPEEPSSVNWPWDPIAIGRIRSPYRHHAEAPHQPSRVANSEFDAFRLELDPAYEPGLKALALFRYAYVVYWLDRPRPGRDPNGVELCISPPWAHGQTVGLFASRSPHRPNPIGLSVVGIRGIDGSTVHVDALDALDGTPILDIKPYIDALDCRRDANAGWLDPDAAPWRFDRGSRDDE
jgi:tRNA-Thr(GGU) m(6)t(6)A37 methyltransferase TsaA